MAACSEVASEEAVEETEFVVEVDDVEELLSSGVTFDDAPQPIVLVL